MTATTIQLRKPCPHNNGWYRTVKIKWLVFTFNKTVFLCTDCQDLIDGKLKLK